MGPDHATGSFAGLIRELTGKNPATCYQCAKCSAGCPMAAEMKIRPHDFMRLIYLDQGESLLEEESLWLCLGCGTCTLRCPNKCDPAKIISGLRDQALKRDKKVPRAIAAFHKSFMEQISTFGRVFELGLIGIYKLRTRRFFDDVDKAPGMLKRGKLAFAPQRIKGAADVRRIVEACRKENSK